MPLDRRQFLVQGVRAGGAALLAPSLSGLIAACERNGAAVSSGAGYEVAIAGDGTPILVRDFVSLNGTIVNCAGGPTPCGTWLSCEETTEGTAQGWEREHGYVFEVDTAFEPQGLGPRLPPGVSLAPRLTPRGSVGMARPAEPLTALGRFVHEAVAVDPASGIVYETEHHNPAGFYRFIPNDPGNLGVGGPGELGMTFAIWGEWGRGGL